MTDRTDNSSNAAAGNGALLAWAATRLRGLTIACVAGLCVAGNTYADEDLSDPQQAIEAGREALDSYWGGKNWYDAQADDFKPVNLPPPRKTKGWTGWQWLGDVFAGMGSGFGTLLYYLAWAVLIALVGAVIYGLIRAAENLELRGVKRVESDDGRTHVERVEALPVALERPVDDFLAEAMRLHASGDATLAVVYLFSYQLIELDKHRLLRLVKGKTNRQYLRELRRNSPDHPGLPAILEETMQVFERAFFGAHPPEPGRLKRCFEAVERFSGLAVTAAAHAELRQEAQP
ncbi:MAG: DUF4129 domain-containing protein [Planctomycetota bacterium]